jgi:WhiB family redox-sensing transcriptional regulator
MSNWRDLARCQGVDPEIFHPAEEDDGEAAKAICALCPVREPCLEYAITTREKEGVWGGFTARERRRLVRQRRKSA